MSLLPLACTAGGVVGDRYLDGTKGFEIPLPPPAWTAAQFPGTDIAFRRAGSPATIGVHAECKDPEQGPLRALARHLFFGLKGKRLVEEEGFTLNGSEAYRMLLDGELDGEPVRLEGYVVRHGGCVTDLVYVAAPAAFAGGRADFERMVRGWQPVKRTP